MTVAGQVYYCMHCHNTVLVVGEGEGVLVCCGAKMRKLEAMNTSATGDQALSHILIIVRKPGSIIINIDQKGDPMAEDHYIIWIELQIGEISYQKMLDPGKN